MKYELLQMEEDEKISSYVSKVRNLIHLMKGCREVLTDKMIVDKAHELRNVKRKWVQDSIQALHAQTWKKRGGFNKFNDKGDKSQSKKSWVNSQKHKFDDRAPESSKRGEGTSYQKDKHEKKSTQCYNCEKWVADEHIDSKIWFLDTGCSNHMTDRRVWLANFDELKKRKVRLADNSYLQAEGFLVAMKYGAYKLLDTRNNLELSEHKEIPVNTIPITVEFEA
ncbi:uncharacterized protein LOC127103657 [Lathyrus oleraceus]|uniref:uncharacterized protein LOC127103657 n=1 Tax=Pisum sativum TaxID=3888 RepID=UPI0021D0BE08|nr:uncharacterized protein LOC127103657 [Pisum sativum]